MKRFFILLFLMLVILSGFHIPSAQAQKYAYVDTDYVLKHMPEYAAAQRQLNEISSQWQKEIERLFTEAEDMEQAYQAEQMLLTEAMRKKKEDEINKKKTEAKELQRAKFGPGGELFNKQASLVKPIQDKVYKAIEQIAEDGMYAVIFDKAKSEMLYASPRYDKSNDVLLKLGIKPGDFANEKK